MGAFAFGFCAALGGALGTPLGGWFTDWAARRSVAAAGVAGPVGFGGPADAPAATTARALVVETRALIGSITVLITCASVFMILTALLLFTGRGPMQKAGFFVLLTVGIAFTYGCSAGISRAAMLLVPVSMRALALAFMTMAMHALGDVPSPIIFGLMAKALAPSCVGNPSETCLGHGGDGADGYTSDQRGLLFVLLLGAFYMVTCSFYWGFAYALMAMRARRRAVIEAVAEPLPPLSVGARHDVSVNSGRATMVE